MKELIKPEITCPIAIAKIPRGIVIKIFNMVITFLIISSFRKTSLRPSALIPVRFAV